MLPIRSDGPGRAISLGSRRQLSLGFSSLGAREAGPNRRTSIMRVPMVVFVPARVLFLVRSLALLALF